MANREYDIFISYASEDSDKARWLRHILHSEGWKSFVAEEDLNKTLGKAQWSKKIDETLDGSGLVIVLVSPESIKSQWVDYEWRSTHIDILRGQPGMIIPCCLREIGPDDLGRALRRYQCIDLRNPKKKQSEISKLLQLIEGYLQEPIGKRKERNLVKVLSLEGGGSRVLISCRVLVSLEEEICRLTDRKIRLADCFDMIAGTSAGGILACLLALPDRSAKEIVKSFKEQLPRAFRKSNFPKMLTKHTYQSSALRDSLSPIFKEIKLSELATPCLIPTYDLLQRRPMLLGQHRARDGYHPDIPAVDAALASTSMPLAFAPYELQLSERESTLLVDGCLYAKNPARLAVKDVQDFSFPRPLPSEICLLSLGNGQLPARKDDPRNWYKWDWIPEITKIPMNATADLVHDHFTQLYKTLGFPNQYLRIDSDLSSVANRIFKFNDVRAETIAELDRLGKEQVKGFTGEIAEFARLLVKDM